MNNLLRLSLAICFFAISFSLSAQKKALKVVSKKEIKAAQVEVYDVLRNLERFPEWSPFIVEDPEQKNYVTGEAGQVGSAFHWEGVAEKSKGLQTLAVEDGVVEVTQTFELKCSGFNRFMMKLFGVKKHITKSNELGLTRLKTLLENETTLETKL